MRISDWSSDVCSSDLLAVVAQPDPHRGQVDRGEPLAAQNAAAAGGGEAGRLQGERHGPAQAAEATAARQRVAKLVLQDYRQGLPVRLPDVEAAPQHVEPAVAGGGQLGRAHVWTPV